MNTYFVKSFEEDFSTKTLIGKEKTTFQKIEDILHKKIIKPNTKSFGQKRRLSTTILHKNYTKTYRPQGIIFQTNVKPDYILPFDLVLLSDAKEIIVHYYKIKDNLHFYYNHKLINGYEKFIFDNINLLLEKFDSPLSAWNELNSFRKEKGYPTLPKSKFRLVEYNEAVFHKSIKIKPIAIFGYNKKAKEIAKKYNLKYFINAKSFYKSIFS